MTHAMRCYSLILCLALCMAGPAFTQTETVESAISPTTTAAPVANIYVATSKGIELFHAASNGKLAIGGGSPFAGKLQDIVTNGKWFYGTDGTYIYRYSVASDGGLKLVGKLNPAVHSGVSEGSVSYLNLDHTGATLYCNFYEPGEGTDYQSYSISKSNGDLTWLGNAGSATFRFGFGPLEFLGNNKFAFQTQSYLTWFTAGFARESNGALEGEIQQDVFPTAKSNDGYSSYAITGDPTNLLAVAVYPQNEPPGPTDGPTQLAVYVSDSKGKLTTKSTYENMPVVAVDNVSDMNMSPSGKLLAVAGSTIDYTGNGTKHTGLQVFHFNGNAPITKYTELLTKVPIDNVHWDNSNHLYAISKSAGKLYVFTVTPTSVSEAAGSPYSVSSPVRLIVRPL